MKSINVWRHSANNSTSTQNLSLHRDYNCTSGLCDIHSRFLEGFMIYPNQNLRVGHFPPRDEKNCCFGFVVGMVDKTNKLDPINFTLFYLEEKSKA